MIELRWLVDPRSDAHRVLQYREGFYGQVLKEIRHANSKPVGIGLSEHGWQGTDWMDVPVETAPSKEVPSA